MKKCVLIIVSILTIAMSVLTMFVSEKRLAAKSLFLANVNALARDETGGGEVPGIPVPGPEGWTRGTCQSNGGNWNMSTMVKDAETVTSTCTIKGEVNVCGVKVSGEYVVGGKYEMQITIYSCEASKENCCIKMGSYYGEHKLS